MRTFDKQGQQFWHGALPGSPPRDGAGGEWALRESDDLKHVVVSWIGGNERTTYRLDAATGRLLMHDIRPSEKDADGVRPGTPLGAGSQLAQSRPRSGVVDGGKPKDEVLLGESITAEPPPGEAADQNRIALFRQRLTGLGYFENGRRTKGDKGTAGRPALAFGNGHNRIYIFNPERMRPSNVF